MSEIEPFPGEDASELGMAARKEWPVILWFSSTKSDKMVASHMFSLAFVRSFPERKANTGLVGSKIPTFSAEGQVFSPLRGNTSSIQPLKPVVLVKGTNISTYFSAINFTFSHLSDVAASKVFSLGAKSLPILHKV